jgi:hypothetical protein
LRSAASLAAALVCALAAPAAVAQAGAWHGPDSTPPAAIPAQKPQAPAPVLRRFEPPTVQGLVVDQCESWSRNCGDGGAKAFCRLRGYDRLVKWEHSKPGRTWVIGSARDCTGDFCTGYRYVECAGLLPVTAPGTRRFQPALANGMTADNCESWSTNCGEPGARAYCRAQGYGRALQWELNRPGRTWVIGSNRACEGESCIGFTYVVCAEPGGGRP